MSFIEIIDFLYILRLNENDHSSLERFKCSVESVIKNTYKDVRICIADNSKKPLQDILEKVLPISFDYTHKYKYENYNRSYNINFGVKNLIRSNQFFISDIDIIYPSYHIEKHIEEKNYQLIFPQVIRMGKGILTSDYEKLNQQKEGLKVPIGGICYCSLDLFYKVNGYDESYEGWGGEDDDFRVRAGFFGKILIPKQRIISKVFHLWHEPFIRDQKILFQFRDKNATKFYSSARKYKNGELDPQKVNLNGWGI